MEFYQIFKCILFHITLPSINWHGVLHNEICWIQGFGRRVSMEKLFSQVSSSFFCSTAAQLCKSFLLVDWERWGCDDARKKFSSFLPSQRSKHWRRSQTLKVCAARTHYRKLETVNNTIKDTPQRTRPPSQLSQYQQKLCRNSAEMLFAYYMASCFFGAPKFATSRVSTFIIILLIRIVFLSFSLAEPKAILTRFQLQVYK